MLKRVSSGSVRITLQDDDMAIDPRSYDNLGTIVCWHGRYDLGDKHSYKNVREWLMELLSIESINAFVDKTKGDYEIRESKENGIEVVKKSDGELLDDKFTSLDEAEKWLDDYLGNEYIINELSLKELGDIVEQEYVILPVFMYDHSGITINTIGFSCPWDSGQIGYIYIKKSPEYEVERLKQILRDEIKVYDAYLRGECFILKVDYMSKCEHCGHVEYELQDSIDFLGWLSREEAIEMCQDLDTKGMEMSVEELVDELF